MVKPAHISRSAALHGERAEKSLIIDGARVAMGPETAVKARVEIGHGRIRRISPSRVPGHREASSRRELRLDLSGWLLLPGLINAHDHLELNLFPRLGRGPFQNYREWAEAVYHPDLSPVRDHLRVPKDARIWWGAIKNLLSGVTTVCHHNPPIPRPLIAELPIRVLRQYGWAHSPAYGGDVSEAFRATPPGAPFIIHLAEGTDDICRQEIFELERMGALSSNTVIIHGVGLDAHGHRLLDRAGAALVWCPTSNVFTLGRTLGRDDVLRHRRVAIGSDSAMTAAGDLLDEVRFACHESGLGAPETYRMVTTASVDVLRLPQEFGQLAEGSVADLIAVRDLRLSPCETLVGLASDRVELVMIGGAPTVMSPALADRWPAKNLDGFEPLRAGPVERLVKAPISRLLREATKYLGASIALSGRRLSA